MNMQILNEQQRTLSRQELINYFEPRPKATLILVGFLILLFLGAPCASLSVGSNPIAGLTTLSVFAIPLAIGILIQTKFNMRPRPTDQEYDEWVGSFRASIRQYGLQRLGLSQSDIIGEPLYVRGIVLARDKDAWYYDNMAQAIMLRRGKDARLRSSVNRFTMFYPTQHYIAVFIGDVNALSDLRFEGTQTYYYHDIVGVETRAFGMPVEGVNYGLQRFDLQVSNGRSIGVTTIAEDRSIEQTVHSLGVLLRDKKYGINGGGRGFAGY
jgi:hypothetical protein